jgi:phage baseplate assembly protein W
MALYKGFSTKSFRYNGPTTIVGTVDNDFGPYTLTDDNLIIMDLINSLNIRKGEKLMNPGYGCKIWEKIFEPLTKSLKDELYREIDTTIKSDPRISLLNRVTIDESPDGHGLLLDIQILIKESNELVNLNLAFDGTTGVVNTQVSY